MLKRFLELRAQHCQHEANGFVRKSELNKAAVELAKMDTYKGLVSSIKARREQLKKEV